MCSKHVEKAVCVCVYVLKISGLEGLYLELQSLPGPKP